MVNYSEKELHPPGAALFLCDKMHANIRNKKKPYTTVRLFYAINDGVYFPLLASATYFSNAIVIEGASGEGAMISTRRPCSKASF